MRRFRLFKNTAVRLAVTFAALFAVIYLFAGVATLGVIQSQLDGRADRLIKETSAVISATYGSADITDLTDSVNSYAIAAPGKDRIFVLTDSGGQVLAGNVTGGAFAQGWTTVSGATLGLPANRRYRVFTTEVGPTLLSVGMSDEDTRSLRNIALTSFGWISVLAFVLAIIGGLLVGRRAQARLDGIANAMGAVGRGDLSARAAVSSRDDDIDQVARQINAALERLAALVEGMRQVSSDIAHELRTPLNRLALTVNSARERFESGEDVAAELEEIETECFRISETFDALLRIAQIEAGARKARFALLPIRPIIEAIGDAYAGVAEDGGRHLVVRLQAGQPLRVSGDSDLLTQMIANLVENALRHTPEGSTVRIEAGQDEQERVRISVSDDGPGIPEDERERVFQRLYRLDRARTIDGNGLGLSLVKAVAELHGGTVRLADNAPGLRAVVVIASA
ncbi:MAG TPA: ATP-binding protein [Devosiaceae bacterium]